MDDWYDDLYGIEPKAFVCLSCNSLYKDIDLVDVIDIYSDIFERDVVTFICPICSQEHESLIVTR